MFGTLQDSKRHPENTKAADHRQTQNDHNPAKGALGNMWDK